MEKYLNQKLSSKERARDLLGRLSLEEKMAQTQCIYPNALMMGKDSVEVAKKDCVYGMGSVSALEVRVLDEPWKIVDYQHRMQDMIMENSPHHIPAVFHMEGLCGGYLKDTLSLPAGISRGASFDPVLEKEMASIVSRQEKAYGITQILAPVLDISRDSRMGRQGETYGEDPTLTAAMGTAYACGIQEQERSDGLKADAVAKHFLGFHNSQGGIHGADSLTPPRLLEEIYGRPFQAAISKAKLKGIMPCYCTFDGEAASTSETLLKELLRERMGFEGLCVSDYTGIEDAHKVQGMYESLTETGLHAMEAGMNMEWPKKAAYNEELLEWFRDGKADIAVLDKIVEQILEAKFRMGLFEHPYALEGEMLAEELHREGEKEIVLKSAEESIVLLKNNRLKGKNVLPLGRTLKKIAVIGPHGDNARSLFGGYTHVSMAEALNAMRCSIAGFDETGKMVFGDYEKYPGTNVQVDVTKDFDSVIPFLKPGCKSLYQALKEALPETEVVYAYGYPVAGNDTAGYGEALEKAQGADVIILTLGGKYSSSSIATMGEGVDATDINLPQCQDDFILKAKKLGIPLVGIHFDGRPISSDTADRELDAILEAFEPGEMGADAIVNILLGTVNPSGKLPVSVAYNAGQIPIYYNHPNGSAYHQGASIGFAEYVDCRHTPRYYFGYGLSYTAFAYENLKLSRKEVTPAEQLTVSVDVKNEGEVSGCEVVQLYLKDVYASKVRPCMELGGFARVDLKPGEKKTVSFLVSMDQLAFLDTDMRWIVEAGEIQVMIGKGAGNICLEDSFRIKEDLWIDGKSRSFWAKASIS